MSEQIDPVVDAARKYQATAQMIDEAMTAVLDEAGKFDVDPGGVLAGAMTAFVRFSIRHMIKPGPKRPTVRMVLDFMLPALNKAAEAQLQKPSGKAN